MFYSYVAENHKSLNAWKLEFSIKLFITKKMDKVIYCGFQTVSGESEFFRQSTIGKGKKLYASGHIDSVREVTNLGMPSITAKCLSQVSVSKIYDVSFKVNK